MSDKPKSLQDLISANALIDAFMGGTPASPRKQHPEAKIEALLASIELCNDIESLVEGVESDMQSIKDSQDTTTQLDFLAARLARIKSLLYNERTASTSFAKSIFQHASQFKTAASALLFSLEQNHNRKMLFPTLLSNLTNIPFEARKDVASIFNYLLVCGCVYSTAGGGGGGGVVNEVQMEGSSEAITASYTKTMLGFVDYVFEHYGKIMEPIVNGHYVRNGPSLNDNVQDGQESGSTITQRLNTVDIALLSGSMYRSTLRHPKLYANLLTKVNSEPFVYPFLDSFGNQANFELSSDALETLRLIMHPIGNCIAVPSLSISSPSTIITNPSELESLMDGISAAFLDREFDSIFMKRFNVNMLNSENANYITRRVSLQILSTVLLTRTNYNVMIKYISNRSNLRVNMMLLRDSSAHITLEAFNVFKIFVANPKKPEGIIKILADNKLKLVKYLKGLHQEKEANDLQFRDEKALVIATLEQLD